MTPAPLRRDAARNRDGILAAARSLADEGLPLQLNAVARRADVGVGTVYRHFPTTEALVETLVEGRFDDLTQRATDAAGEADAAGALRGFLAVAMRVYVDDVAFARVATTSDPALDTTKARRRDLIDAFAVLLDRVGASSHIRSPLGPRMPWPSSAVRPTPSVSAAPRPPTRTLPPCSTACSPRRTRETRHA
ncbi:hypothetical protein AX769_20420 [Frondihabitans sp. PAMC 28766]|uniref:TetR/AcrR family transcriptional regulator n=1 Tax=Frondihabitans sp. PAMC 28766 TaxID=1795630 RepID=UPI00078BFB19|nr:TetR/AcrR family transcriptional regulator [Frondihabitans sp. PAMC 28766]AMM22080.1 hypothetical protein AX769_20420 [Frondihabitans sp. PAMC 28766]